MFSESESEGETEEQQEQPPPPPAAPVEVVELEDEEEEEEHEPEPPQKMARLDSSFMSDDDDGVCCIICSEAYTNAGSHRCCCLKCGHIFGKECIEKWIATAKACPSCKAKATKKDIRVLYGRIVKMTDTTELERVREDNKKLMVEHSKAELSNAKLRMMVDIMKVECSKVEAENRMLKSKSKKVAETEEAVVVDLEQPGPSFRTQHNCTCPDHDYPHPHSSKTSTSGLRNPKLRLLRRFEIKEGQCRVGTYKAESGLMVVSHAIKSALFPGGSYGIKILRMVDMKPYQSFPIHQRALRDMGFSPDQPELLLTVGLDRKAVLFNVQNNCNAQTFQAESPLWSCCWNGLRPHIFYVGTANGQIISYDIRNPAQTLGSIVLPAPEKSAVARLRFVPPSYESQTFNMSGLLIQKLNSVWMADMLGGDDSDPRFHQLPLEGPFLNVEFEKTSRHVLVSSRPKQGRGSGHAVCVLGKTYSEAEDRHVFNCDVVQNIRGGFNESSILCRSSLFSPRDGQLFVAANGEVDKTVKIWNVSNVEQKTQVQLPESAAIDFIPGQINDTRFLGILTDKFTDLYEIL